MIICPNLKNPDVAREFEELKNATSEAAAYHIWSLNNGNSIDKAPNGAESKLFLTLLEHFGGDRIKAIQAKAKVYGKSFLNWFGNWTGHAYDMTPEELELIDLIYHRFPQLALIGTKELYNQYIQSIFPKSKDKSVYWHGSNSDFSEGFESATRGEGSGAQETKERNDFYLAKQAWTVLLYVDGVNRKSVDKNGFAHWNKLWWEFKEIMSNGRRENNDWKDLVINEQNVRLAIPNKRGVFNRDKGGGNGKWLSERKADYGYENKSDKEFFEEILGVKWGEDTFNTWTQRNAEIFKSLQKDTKGIYPAVINTQNPITESGLNTYYEEQRGLMTKANEEGNDAILSEKADNEFGSDVAVVLNIGDTDEQRNSKIHFLGTKSDIESFKQFVEGKDWTVSKVVDENGEPMVVWHGARERTFEGFDPDKIINGGGFWFTHNKWEAYYNGDKVAAFLNMRSPYNDIKLFNKKYGDDAYEKIMSYYRKFDDYEYKLLDWRATSEYTNLPRPEEPNKPNYPEKAFGEAYHISYGNELFLSETSDDPAYYRSRQTRLDWFENYGIDGEITGSYYVVVNPDQIIQLEKGTTKEQIKEDKEQNVIPLVDDFSKPVNRLSGIQLQLARAFGLVLQEDGSWITDSSAPYSKLRVEFVNNLSHAGAYTHNSQTDAMCHLIQIGLTHGDASTFNHELAHHYIRIFWNSKVVQDALNSVYNKKMGDINDPKVREAVEEKLVDMMTERSVDDMFKSNIEHKSFFQNFWEKFNTMLYLMFGIKNKTVRDALADNLTSLFMENELLENTILTPKILMYEGTVYLSEYQKRTVKKSPTEKYNIHDLTRSDETVTQRIIAATQSKAKAYELKSTIGTIDGIYGDADQMARNQEAVRQVRILKTLIEEAHAAHDAQEEIRQKVKLFKSFINMSNEEVTYILRLLLNAQANNYEKLMYVEDVRGNRSYTLQTGELITDANAPANAKTQPFGFDELQYAAEDVIGFIGPIILAICNVISDAKMLGYTDSDIQELEDALHSTLVTTLMVNHIQPLYKSALQNKLFKWVDEVVDAREELSDDFKNRLRINMKKWLTDQQDFGDVGLVEVIAGMGSQSKSPIIRAMQDMINDMVEERDELVYKKGIDLMDKKRKAEKAMAWKYRVLPYNFLKLLMQLDDRGLPTGYFISEINKGLYIQDKNNYRDLLLFGDKKHKGLELKLKELKDAAGNPIYVDENNKPIDKLVFDEYGFPVVPKNDQAELLVKEYLTDFEVWRCRHSNRQFTERYYKDRIKYLSLDAMRALNRVDLKLEAITNAITINGVPRMDLLSPAQREEYLQYLTEKDFLGSIYNPDGSMKAPGSDEYNIAVSIRDFRLSMKGAIVYKTNTASYLESYNNAKNKADFERHFTHWQVNPEIYKYISQNKKSNRSPFDPEVIKLAELLYERNKLVQSIQGMSIGEIKWDKIYDENTKRIKNEQFWNALRSLDENINLLQGKLNLKYGKDNSLFLTIMEPYMIPYNRAGNWANSQSVFDKIKNDIRNSVFADPNLTLAQKQAEWFRLLSMLLYYCATKDVELPLDIFTTFLPRNKYTLDVLTGEQYVNFVLIPVSVFLMVDVEHSNPDYVNEDFDQTSSEYEQPIEALYKDKRYDKYVKGNAELEELLTALKSTMEEDSWKAIPFLGLYDGRLPQIGARNGQILGRKIGTRLFKNLGEFFRREWEVVETDTEFSPDGDIQRRPDGSRIRNVPIRFVKMLDRPEYISSDIVGSVILFYNMALNYRLKALNASLLTRIMSMLRESDTGRRSGQLSRQYETMSGIVDRQLYENNAGIESYGDEYASAKWGKFDWFRRWMVVGGSKNWIKRIGKARASMLIGTLAFNISSGIVSFLDPLLSLIVDASTGKYINIWNELLAIRYLIGNLFLSLFSLGKVKSYGKLGAAMQKFLLAKSNSETFRDTDKGLVYRFLSDGLKMKIFSWGDYTMNSISLIATMNNYHLYTDPSGNQRFLPKTLYISTYMKDYKCDANTARHEYRHSENMWDCCEVDRKTGEFKALEKYEKIIDDKTWGDVRKQVRSRASMYNGIVPGNERTMMLNHPFFSFLTVLRNFMITGVQERFKNQRDFLVTTFDLQNNPSITDIDDTKTLSAHEAKHTQQYYKGGLNFDTRLIEDGIYTCMGNWLRHMLPYARFMFLSFASPFCKKFNTRNVRSQEFEDYTSSNKLNKNSIYSAQRVFLEILVIALMWNLVPVVRRIADDDLDDWFLLFLNLITLRVAIERTTWFSPNTFLDLVLSPTALYSDWKRRLKIIDLITESIGLSDYSPTDEVKTGNFKGVPRWEYNLLSALSGFGTHNWYTNMPKELGGGGAPVVRKKEGFYHKLIPDPAKWIFLPNKTEDEKGKKSRGSRSRSRSRSRNRRSRD